MLFILAVAVGITTRVHVPGVTVIAGATVFACIAFWMFLSERPEWPLTVLALYLGLLDGYLKLSTGVEALTIVRDVLLYAIVVGILARAAIRRQHLALPPLGGWVVAFVTVVLVQLLNPADAGIAHSLAALRPELEFMPLFFLGYQVVRTPTRLRRFILILLVCATANGIANFVQFNLTPSQFATWGKGYATYLNGTGSVSGRTFIDSAGQVKVRPFGLGTDAGTGAQFGLISIGGALALLVLGSRRLQGWVLLLLCLGAPLAIFTGQLRSATVAGVLAAAFFVVLAVSARRIIPTLAALALGVLITVGVASLIASNSGNGVFSRYATITPSSLLSSTAASRGGSLSSIPTFVTHYPLGGGLGSVGPASRVAGGATQILNGETGFTFYISDIGIPGLLVMLLFNLKLLGGSLRRIRRMDHETRVLLAGLAAGLAGLFVEWASSNPLVTSPGAPYFWFTAGVLAYWLYPRRRAAPLPAS
ncbi:MAG TPA: hypothetical protein VGG41_04350 [Solirubrobacteraceae bacterium]|jgi:hypothetical protein